MKEMYKGVVNSPETTITNDISNTDTLIYVLDDSRVPDVLPNLMTIGTGTNAETIKVVSKAGSAITVVRGFQGVAKAWNAGSIIARNFTEYDYNALMENIDTLREDTDINEDGILDLMSYVGDLESLDTDEKANIVLALNEIYQDLKSHKAEKATQEQLGHVKAGNNITIDADGTIEVVIDVGDIPGLVSSSLALGQDALAEDYAVALGWDVSALDRSVALGQDASAYYYAVALGDHALAEDYAVALGQDAVALFSAVAIGLGASAGNYAIALGQDALAEDYAVALGDHASAVGDYSVALGPDAAAGNANEGILGGTGSYTTSKWIVPGTFTVNGTKNFEIPHPKPEKKATHVIRHGAVESPTPGDTLYRYKITATKENDLVTIDLPDYFIWLNKDVQIFVTPQGHFGAGYGILNEETEQLEIHCQCEGEYNVLVIGTRNDDHQSVKDWDIKGVEREIGESWTGETYVFSVDEIMEVEEIKEVSA